MVIISSPPNPKLNHYIRVETNTYQYFVALDDDLKLDQVSKLGNSFFFCFEN